MLFIKSGTDLVPKPALAVLSAFVAELCDKIWLNAIVVTSLNSVGNQFAN